MSSERPKGLWGVLRRIVQTCPKGSLPQKKRSIVVQCISEDVVELFRHRVDVYSSEGDRGNVAPVIRYFRPFRQVIVAMVVNNNKDLMLYYEIPREVEGFRVQCCADEDHHAELES